MKYNSIFLVGFRTVGKSTIGKIVADKLNWSYFDMDFLITQEAGENADSLTKGGTDWQRFRKIENEILGEVSEMKNVVISCGGGVGVNDIIDHDSGKTFGELNKNILNSLSEGLVILLTSSEKSIEQRLKRQYKNKKIMPFLNSENAKQAEGEKDKTILIKKQIADSLDIYKTRKPLYEELTKVKINSDSKSLEETAEEIINYAK